MISVSSHVVVNHLPRAAGQFEPAIAEAINNGLDNFGDLATEEAPRETGHMATNVEVNYAAPGNLMATWEYNADYAIYVHDGTIYLAARPWAEEAADVILPEYVNDVQSAFARGWW